MLSETFLIRVLFISAGLLFGLAALCPMTTLSLVFAWGFVLLLVFGANGSSHRLFDWFLSGVVFSAVAFYWLVDTIVYFGGFHRALAVCFFIAFCLASALQFVLCGWIHKRVSPVLTSLSLPLSWLAAECVWPKLFPWALAHPQIIWTSFSGLAEFVGVLPLGALLIWWGEMLLCAVLSLRRRRNLFKRWEGMMILLSVAVLGIGAFGAEAIRQRIDQAPGLKLAVIQGNLEAKQKGDVRLLVFNIGRYLDLTRSVLDTDAQLFIWPESVFNHWTPENIPNVRGSDYDPLSGLGIPLLYGTLSYRLEKGAKKPLLFNSAFGIEADGKVSGYYHKKVLMPFGEYLPFSNLLPWLKDLSPQTGDLSRGDVDKPITFGFPEKKISVSTLICYEDLIPALSRQAVELGAEFLVNLTNDAWYGDTAAPYQHHLLASWRAIETRRYLVRSTNTGFTGIVDPLGRTVESLNVFSADALLGEVKLFKHKTLYVVLGDTWIWVLSFVVLGFAVLRRRSEAIST